MRALTGKGRRLAWAGRLVESERAALQASEYFQRLWSNDGGHFSVAYEAYEDDSWVKRVIYRLQEFSGLSSF